MLFNIPLFLLCFVGLLLLLLCVFFVFLFFGGGGAGRVCLFAFLSNFNLII